MSQQAQPLFAELRSRVGKGAARSLRRNAQVPAVIYGGGEAPLPIALPYKELSKRVHAGHFLTTLLDIEVDGQKHRVLPREVQFEPVRDFINHVDFIRVGEDSTVIVMIPVHFHNEEASPGLRRGGVLNVVRHEVEVECRAQAIPDAIDVDLTGLEIGDAVHISAVKLPPDVRPTITDRDFTIASIGGAASVLPEQEAEEVEAGDVEVIGEEEKE